MRTEKQKEASRINGARSRGPVTPEGKERSSANAITHGLTAETRLAPGEDRDGFNRLLAELLRQCPPKGPLDYMLLHQAARAYWRLERGAVVEDQYIDGALAAQPPSSPFPAALAAAFSSLATENKFTLVQRYLTRNERSLQRFFYCLARNGALPKPAPPDPAPPDAAPPDAAPPSPPVLPNEPEPRSTPLDPSACTPPAPAAGPVAGTPPPPPSRSEVARRHPLPRTHRLRVPAERQSLRRRQSLRHPDRRRCARPLLRTRRQPVARVRIAQVGTISANRDAIGDVVAGAQFHRGYRPPASSPVPGGWKSPSALRLSSRPGRAVV